MNFYKRCAIYWLSRILHSPTLFHKARHQWQVTMTWLIVLAIMLPAGYMFGRVLKSTQLQARDFGIQVSGQQEMEKLLRKVQELSKKNQLLQEKACKEKNICSDQTIGK